MMRTKTRGFSLIELLIVIAVVAVLVGVAYPTYQENMRKTRRADAKITLESYAALQERWFTENNSYTDDITLIGGTSSQDSHYTISLDVSCDDDGVAPFTCFDLTATATGKQSGDRCATFTLSNVGARGYSGTGGSQEQCW